MQYSAAVRDRFRTAVVAGTGIATVAALSATGWLTGATARDYDAAQARKAAQQEARQRAVRAWQRAHRAQASARPRVVLRERPHRTHVTLRYVESVPGSTAVGPGGAVSVPASVPAPAPAPATNAAPPPPAPPPPPPPPAPSTGS